MKYKVIYAIVSILSLKNLQKAKEISFFLIVSYYMFISVAACKKNVDVGPPVSTTTSESVYNEDVTAISVLTGLYSSLSSGITTGSINISKVAGLSSDELNLWSGASANDFSYYNNTLATSASSSVAAGHETWTRAYNYIFICNSAIEGLSASTTLTPFVKQQLLGEAKFMRAFFYFYLVNLYGDVPLALTSDYNLNNFLPRESSAQVYQQIVGDLKEAKGLLSEYYLNGQLQKYPSTVQPERVRPSSWVAAAMLARVYLFMENYANAEVETSNIISNSLFGLSTLDKAFLKASSGNNEAIWQLQPVNKNSSLYWNSEEARLFILTAAPIGVNSTHFVYLSPQLMSAFENGDSRKTSWIGVYSDGSGTYYFSNKYKIATAQSSSPTEYSTVFRLSEQYLIRSESRAQQNNIAGALADLNSIRKRAGLPDTSIDNKDALLKAILHERQVELFTEWGNRWLDLKRTKTIDSVMRIVTPIKSNGLPWKANQQLYPIPISDIQADPNLLQNDGYN